ncbi:MAG: polysaccharide biosynthesis tyrosine autokinase [Paludibacteraceae bacterium]|nr:polysaccharide biosynthesis tyrosine autokinase [Paludibacteraceae bacterium]
MSDIKMPQSQESAYQIPRNINAVSAPQMPQEEEESNFNLMEWVIRILHYWYLFVIALVIAYGLAYLKNRKWIPQRMSSCTLIIKESSAWGGQPTSLLQGFGVGQGYSNVNNQMIMLRSYDLIGRVVDSLPVLNVDYITQGRFKTRNIYRQSPISVQYTRLSDVAYGILFRCTFMENGRLLIESTDERYALSAETAYGIPLSTPYFTAMFWPTDFKAKAGQHIFFRFRSRESLVDEFIGRLNVQFVSNGSTVMSLSLVSEVPQRDCEFLDKLQDIYLLQNLERKNKVAENSIAFIDRQLETLLGQLNVSEGAMTQFRQDNKFSDVSSYAGTLMSRLSEYDQQNMSLRLKESYLNYLDEYLRKQIEDGAIVAPTSMGVTEPMLTQFVNQLNRLQLERSELTEKNVYYAKYTNDIEQVKDGLAEVIKSMRASLDIERKELRNRYSEVEGDMQDLPEKELQMVSIERNYRIDDNYYTFFLQKRAEAEIQKASNTPDNEIMDRARTTVTTNANAKKKTMTKNLMIGLLIPLLLIILSELLNDKIRTPKEVNKLSNFDLIGTLRHARNQNPILVKDSPRSRYAEMLRTIRTRIEFIVQRKVGIMVCVTSTESGDGKTFFSTNMAALYAMTGKKTILVDLDIRKPNIHDKLGLEDGVGITNYLIGDCSLNDIITHDSSYDFDIVRAGTIPPNPGELIHSDKLADLLHQLRDMYDYVVLDTSPIGLVPDAYSIIELCDTTMYIIRCLQTSKSMCRQTLEQLAVDHKDKIHLILSDLPTQGFHNGYNYGYAYTYGSRTGYGYGKYGRGYGYGYGSSYGSNYGDTDKQHNSIRYRYGQLLRRNKKEELHNYYMDEDE